MFRGDTTPKYSEDLSMTLRKSSDFHDHVLTPWDVQSKRVNTPEGTSPTLQSGTGEGMNIQPIVLQGDGTSSNGSQNGCGYNDDGSAYTLNGRDRQSVCIQGSMVGREEKNGPNGAGCNDELSFTLNTIDRYAVAFAQNTRNEVRLFGGDGETVGALSAQPGMKQTSYVMTQFGEVAGTLSARADSSPCADRGQNVVCIQDFGDCGLMKDSDECNYAKYLAEQGAVTYEYVCCSCGHRFMSGNGPVNTEMDEDWYRIRCPKCGSGRYVDASRAKTICAADDNGKTAIEEDLCGSLKVGGGRPE